MAVWASVGYPNGFGPVVNLAQSIEDGNSPGIVGQGGGLDLETESELYEGMSGGPFWAWFDVGGGAVTPRITGVVSGVGAVAPDFGGVISGDSDNWLGGGNEMVALIQEARDRWFDLPPLPGGIHAGDPPLTFD